MSCDIQRVREGRRRRGRAVLEGLLAAVPHRAGLPGAQRLRPLRLPVQVEGIRRPGQRGLQQRRGAQRPLARDAHLHLLRLSRPTPRTNCREIAAALVKVIKAYAKSDRVHAMSKVKWGVIGSGGIARRRTIPEGIAAAPNARAGRGLRRGRRGQPGGGRAVRRARPCASVEDLAGSGRRRRLHRHARRTRTTQQALACAARGQARASARSRWA